MTAGTPTAGTLATGTLAVADIEALALAALTRAGATEAGAAPLAAAIAAAERDGIASHGLMYLPTYCEHLRCGKVNGLAQPRVDQPTPGVIRVDAGNGFAHPAIAAGHPRLIEAARTQGIACLAIRESYNCGVLGYHTERIAAAGLLGLGFTNAPASIAPAGGMRPVIGTNPISLAVPGTGGVGILIDQSASVVARSEVMKRARAGQPIPEGWALDADGAPTTDAAAAMTGTMVPAGGYKGVGIGLLVEVMAAAMTGALLGKDAAPFSGTKGGPPRTGQFFLAIDPGATAGATAGDGFAARIAMLCDAVTAQPGARLPGAGRIAARARADAAGIAVDPDILARVQALAAA